MIINVDPRKIKDLVGCVFGLRPTHGKDLSRSLAIGDTPANGYSYFNNAF